VKIVLLISLQLAIATVTYSQDSLARCTEPALTEFEGEPVYAHSETEVEFDAAKLYKYITDNLTIPTYQEAPSSSYYVKILIDKEGKVRDICYLRPKFPNIADVQILNNIANCLSTFNEFEPPIKDGKPVNSFKVFPVKICLRR
jgi:hypothetical protein